MQHNAGGEYYAFDGEKKGFRYIGIGKKLKVPKKNSARKECDCFLNGDIGAYNSCAHLCRYCYANADSRLVMENMKLHNPDSPLLIGDLTPDDKIFNTAQKSWIVD